MQHIKQEVSVELLEGFLCSRTLEDYASEYDHRESLYLELCDDFGIEPKYYTI